MAIEEEDDGGGIPEWVVTFGDMMSLLLTFFIMLVSLSEIKKDEQFQALAESLRKQFGHSASPLSMLPGKSPPRNSAVAKLATMGRAKRRDTMRGGDKTQAPTGDFSQVRIIRPGNNSGVGTAITFVEGKADINDEMRNDLQLTALELRGKPQRIEIRGHTSRKPLDNEASSDENFRKALNLAYERCWHTMNFLISLGIERHRFRIAVVGPNEPIETGTESSKLKQNPRVEVLLLDEVASDLEGTAEERQRRFRTPTTALEPEQNSSSSVNTKESQDG